MCGIAGIVYQEAPPEVSSIVRRMIAMQKHRGPDGEGFYSSPGAALGHCRLAILDLTAAGRQPMPDPQQRYWLTFNGEIYNYLELADQLRRAGHEFRTKSDTEVLLAAYAEWGEACLPRLRGMFAFAIWDAQTRRLFAARDRFGIKPFHYWFNPAQTQLAFASELKALLEFLPARRINARLAGEFVAWSLLDHDPAETMLQNVFRLPAAHFLTWQAGQGLRVERYWNLEVGDELDTPKAARASLIAEFRERFCDSISVHLRSDVPVGTCLSGGLDSSTIVCAVSAELRRRGQVKENWQHTFTACFDDPALDERSYAQAVTLQTGTHNHQVFPSGDRLADEMNTWLWHQEEPVSGCGVYAQYCVARLAREHGIKVLLDGQGSDEQLAGYRKFILVYLRQLLAAGRYARAAQETVAFFTSPEILKTSRLAEGRRYLNRTPNPVSLWPAGQHPKRPPMLGLGNSLGRRLALDVTALSLPVLLRFEDRNTMAFGVESRVPFIDGELTEWIARLPADLKLWRGWTKYILREAFGDLLPPLVRLRKSKLGFSTPQSAWLRKPLRPWLTEMLSSPRHLGEIVELTGVTQLFEAHKRHELAGSAETLLFRLAAFENWARLFLDGRREAAGADRTNIVSTASL